MGKRFVTIWFRYLKTDWFSVRRPELNEIPFVLSIPDHGRLVISAVNAKAAIEGIETGMSVADARAIYPSLKVLDDIPGLEEKLLKKIGLWCIRYTDKVALDLPEGLILDVTGSAHLWGGEKSYIRDINTRLQNLGYQVRATMADTIGAAWAIAHYGGGAAIIEPGKQMEILMGLPPSGIRLKPEAVDLLYKLGLRQIRSFIHMPRKSLSRRFGMDLLNKLDQALGNKEENIFPIQPIESWKERLPCLDPIITATGIEIALQRLLEILCKRLQQENLGVRQLVFRGYRIDNRIIKIEIGTHRGTLNTKHLYKLFEEKISSLAPGPGIELFILEALKTEKLIPHQEKLWGRSFGLDNPALNELMDRLTNRFGPGHIHRFIPNEHYWPERSFTSFEEFNSPITKTWCVDRPRPLHLLSNPARIEVAAPIPDYPPMYFRFKEKLHLIKKADGPERIEAEWWIQQGLHRDYYTVEDEEGIRFWIFRLGHYSEDKNPEWYLHGLFA